jgi:predicted DNA-binding transcriptional regulator AlpA
MKTLCPNCGASVATPEDLGLLTQQEVAKLAAVSKRQFQRLEAAGEGPARTELSERCIRYTRRAVAEWIAQHSVFDQGSCGSPFCHDQVTHDRGHERQSIQHRASQDFQIDEKSREGVNA